MRIGDNICRPMDITPQIKMWIDTWFDNGPLRSLISDPLVNGEIDLRLDKASDSNGSWAFSNLSFDLPQEILALIKGTLQSYFGVISRPGVWRHSVDGKFSTNSAYLLACGWDPSERPEEWIWLWKLDAHPRFQFFLWLCCHKRIFIATNLQRQGMNILQQICIATSWMGL